MKKQLDLGYYYKIGNSICDIQFYKEHGIYQINGFIGQMHISESFEDYKPAYKLFKKLGNKPQNYYNEAPGCKVKI